MKKIKKNKFLFVAMGPGETVQGVGLAKYATKTGNDIIFIVRAKENYDFVNKQIKDAKICIAERNEDLRKVFDREKPDVLVLCNSKLARYYDGFFAKSLSDKIVSVSLDSNWLFDKDGGWYSCADWLDRYFIIFPREIFDLGLKKYGGNYGIHPEIAKRIETVGFIPFFKKPSLGARLDARRKYGIKKYQKLVFSYFSGYGADHREWAFDNLEKSVDVLRKKGLDLKVLYVGAKKDLSIESMKKEWLIAEEKMSIEDFYLALASSDLVFQHQGFGTLSQVFSANIPAIVNVMDLSDEHVSNHAHAWELAPFAKLGLCNMFYRSTSVIEISREMEKLLFDKKAIEKMKTIQKKYYFSGEANAYKTIKQLLKNKKIQPIKN